MKPCCILLGLLWAMPVFAKHYPTILISDNSSCKVGNAEIIKKVSDAKFPENWTIVITCNKEDWERWRPAPDVTDAFSKGEITFIWGAVLETAEGNEILDREVKKISKQYPAR
jgi:signal recognition particle receptor subunit beta